MENSKRKALMDNSGRDGIMDNNNWWVLKVEQYFGNMDWQ